VDAPLLASVPLFDGSEHSCFSFFENIQVSKATALQLHYMRFIWTKLENGRPLRLHVGVELPLGASVISSSEKHQDTILPASFPQLTFESSILIWYRLFLCKGTMPSFTIVRALLYDFVDI
jgi:hypothetical protein